MSEKILVVGSNSFSGAHFVDSALSEGAQVIGISRSEEPIDAFLPYKKNKNKERFHFKALDLNGNLAEIVRVLEDFRPEYVVNFAAQSMVAESWQNPEHWFQTNCVGQVRFQDQLRKMSFIKKYVHISTPEVYGNCVGKVTEEAPFNPSTPYATSRAANDMSLNNFLRNYKFPVVFTRAANVFGPGQQLYRIIPRTILYALVGKQLELHGGGHSTRSFIHIKDVSDGTLKAMRYAEPGNVFHLSTDIQISIRNLVEKIAGLLNVPFSDLVKIVDERPGKDAAYWLDSSKARSVLGWKDNISLEKGLDQTIDWLKVNLEEIKKTPFNYIHKP